MPLYTSFHNMHMDRIIVMRQICLGGRWWDHCLRYKIVCCFGGCFYTAAISCTACNVLRIPTTVYIVVYLYHISFILR